MWVPLMQSVGRLEGDGPEGGPLVLGFVSWAKNPFETSRVEAADHVRVRGTDQGLGLLGGQERVTAQCGLRKGTEEASGKQGGLGRSAKHLLLPHPGPSCGPP